MIANHDALRFPLEGTDSLIRLFRREIIRVLQHSDLQKQTAQRSYRHPNGFEKIVLVSDLPEIEELRIHRWCDDLEDTNIHSHSWNFQSYVLKGSLTHHLWQLCAGDEVTAFLMPPILIRDGLADEYEFEELGRFSLESLGVFQLAQGSFYRMNSGLLHRVKSTRDAVSLVVQAGFDRPASIVVGDAALHGARSRVERLSVGEVASVLSETLEAIGDARS